MPLSESDKAKLGKPGWVYVQDDHGARMVPWQEASPNPIAGEQDVLLDISEQVQHMRDTAPPIVKTSGQAKAEKMMALFLQFVRDGERQLGRPFTVADLSDQWVQAMRLDILKADGFDLSDASELTPELLRKVAEYYCEESGNKLAEGKGQVVRPF